FQAFRLSGPDRLVIDLFGSVLNENAAKGLPEGVRVGQFAPDVTRIVVDHARMAVQPVPANPPARRYEVDLVHVGVSDIAVRAAPTPPPTVPVSPGTTQPLITVDQPTVVSESTSEGLFRVPLSTVGTTSPSAQYVNPNTIQIVIPNAQTTINREGELGNGSFVTRSSLSNDGRGNVVWLLTTSRAFAFRIGVNGKNLDIRLIKPTGSNGSLTGKIIIVDAGHGGHDPGAAAGGLNEKGLTISIARQVARQLTDAGASVIMTREDDRFIDLSERPAIANRSQADLFISVHINSNTVANSRSGSIMFYHMDSPLGGLLAALLDDEIKQVSQLPSLGTRSDRTIYQSGFAVLRLSSMPAVLMEMGFINHSTDRSRLAQEQYQQAVAGAVTRAVKRFFAR
ncbi:MAG: N-acetylmuramoyl-L-alanine amidase, partial [Fimbriimonadaceae bacterium]|nr:N-acetylmuramoyl-L-alanine amidase [Fimbriimonadaceae bacterium]